MDNGHPDSITEMTQYDEILRWFREEGQLTVGMALNELGVGSFTKRISVLRSRGYDIKDMWVYGRNRYGRKIKWKVYWL